MGTFPLLSDAFRLERLTPPVGGSRVRMVLDTDTFNEVDDQFAVAHVLGSPERVAVEAIYAAPFFNERSSRPGDGMEKSYGEILRLLGLMKVEKKPPVFRGATRYLELESPERTAVVEDLIGRAMEGSGEEPLYVVAIGAITNVAAAMLIEPRIIERIVVVWLGGHALHYPDTREFNLKQDIPAARVVLDTGVPLVLVPCGGVAYRLMTTVQELEGCLSGRCALGDYLVDIVRKYNTSGRQVWSKVIWDVAATAWVINPAWVPSHLAHSPVLTGDATWSARPDRHFIRVAGHVQRDEIFADVFEKVGRL